MKTLITILVLLSSAQCFAATAQVNSVLQIGGKIDSVGTYCNIPTGTLPVLLFGNGEGLTVGNRQFFVKSATATQTQYQVPVGKTFVACGFWLGGTGAITTQIFAFGYNTSSFSNNSAVGAGDIYYAASSTIGLGGIVLTQTGSTGQPMWLPYPVSFPASSYPFWRGNTAGNFGMLMIGYEI